MAELGAAADAVGSRKGGCGRGRGKENKGLGSGTGLVRVQVLQGDRRARQRLMSQRPQPEKRLMWRNVEVILHGQEGEAGAGRSYGVRVVGVVGTW